MPFEKTIEPLISKITEGKNTYYVVRYYINGAATSITFPNYEDAKEFKASFEKFRLQNKITELKMKMQPLDYPDNILKVLGLYDNSNYLDIRKNFDKRLEFLYKNIGHIDPRGIEFTHLNFYDYKTLEEIGKENNLTRERVRQIVQKHLQLIKRFEKYLINDPEIMELDPKKAALALFEEKRDQYLKLYVEDLKKQLKTPNLADPYDTMYIEELDLSVRTYNALKRAGYGYVGQLRKLTYYDFKKIRNMGEKSVKEIMYQLSCL